MKIIDQGQSVRTSDVISIQDDEKNIKWFLAIERTNGKFEWKDGAMIREMINPEYFKSMTPEYRQKVYDLAFNAIKQ